MADVHDANVTREEIMKQIGINLGKIKTVMGWKQAKMAEITGVAEPTMANYLKGERLPGIDYLVNLCAMDCIRKKGLILHIDDFLSSSFDPVRAQTVIVNTQKDTDVGEHDDFIGSYICYFYDQSKPVHDQDEKTTRELRFGILSVYDDCNRVTGDKKMKVFAAFYKEEALQEVIAAKAQLDGIFKAKQSMADRNEALLNFFRTLKEGSYTGGVTFSNQHAFVSLQSDVYSDQALLILYSPRKRTDNDYLGGIGSLTSVAHGRMHMPTAQKLIMSRYELGCSFEEISDYLSMSSAPVSQTEEALAIAEICKCLYGESSPMADILDEKDKTAIIETRLNQLVRNYIEKNVCCVGSVSEEEDKKVYALIKRYVD